MSTYVVTGGASGIGDAISQQLRDEGYDVLVVDLQQADIVADLSTTAGRTEAIASIERAAGNTLAGLVACAGVGPHVPQRKLITAVNYFGAVDLVVGLRPLLAQNAAPVVLVSSNSAPMVTDPDYVDALLSGNEVGATSMAEKLQAQQVYSGTKQALTRWMRSNSQSYAAQGIRMNAIGPGYTQTPLSAASENNPEFTDSIKRFIDSIPIGRRGQPQDMANATSFLLSEKASFICGAMLFIDGGHDAMLRPHQF